MSKNDKRGMDEKGRSRRNLLKASAAAGVAAVTGAGSGVAAGRDDDDDRPAHGGELALVNGRIHTMDDRNRVVSAVLIRNGRFVAVGRRAESGHGATRRCATSDRS